MPKHEALWWRTAPMSCVICLKRWIATYAAATRTLECPECGFLNGAPEEDGNEAV
jgi:hypothetical protein